MTGLIANVASGQNRLRAELALHADAVLVAYRQLVIVHIQAGNARSVDGLNCSRPSLQCDAWVVHRDAVETHLQAERDVRTGVVHVVALNALIHDAESAADNGLAGSSDVIGEPDARTESSPVVVDQALGNAVLAGDANSVQVERNAGEDGVRTGA